MSSKALEIECPSCGAPPGVKCTSHCANPVVVDDPIEPSYYQDKAVRPIEAIKAWGFGSGFCAGNAIKYIARHMDKGKPIEDLEKARWYLDRLIEIRKEENKQ